MSGAIFNGSGEAWESEAIHSFNPTAQLWSWASHHFVCPEQLRLACGKRWRTVNLEQLEHLANDLWGVASLWLRDGLASLLGQLLDDAGGGVGFETVGVDDDELAVTQAAVAVMATRAGAGG